MKQIRLLLTACMLLCFGMTACEPEEEVEPKQENNSGDKGEDKPNDGLSEKTRQLFAKMEGTWVLIINGKVDETMTIGKNGRLSTSFTNSLHQTVVYDLQLTELADGSYSFKHVDPKKGSNYMSGRLIVKDKFFAILNFNGEKSDMDAFVFIKKGLTYPLYSDKEIDARTVMQSRHWTAISADSEPYYMDMNELTFSDSYCKNTRYNIYHSNKTGWMMNVMDNYTPQQGGGFLVSNSYYCILYADKDDVFFWYEDDVFDEETYEVKNLDRWMHFSGHNK